MQRSSLTLKKRIPGTFALTLVACLGFATAPVFAHQDSGNKDGNNQACSCSSDTKPDHASKDKKSKKNDNAESKSDKKQSEDKNKDKAKDKNKEDKKMQGVLTHTMTSITGKDVPLSNYKGDVLLIVNTASKCGLTPQYEGLQQLHEDYSLHGLRVLGFPANNFGNQEPGSDDEIAAFCSEKYDVEFQMFSKISVKGDDIHPLYQYLTNKEKNPKFGGEIGWNFTKFLVDRKGNVVARFGPRDQPTDEKVTKLIEKTLNADAKSDKNKIKDA